MIDYEKEYLETVEMLPQQPPEETAKVLKDRGFFSEEVLVYQCVWIPVQGGKKKKMVQVHCTACGAVMNLEYASVDPACGCSYGYQPPYTFIHPDFKEAVRHASQTLCPACGHEANVRYIGTFAGECYRISSNECMSVHAVNGHLCLLVWNMNKYTTKEGDVKYRADRERGIILIGKRAFRTVGYQTSNGYGGWHFEKWQPRKKYREDFGQVNKKRIIPFKRKTVYETDSANCALYEFLNSNTATFPSLYLKLWQRYPNIENLVKAGFGKMLSSAIDTATSNKYYTYNTVDVTFDMDVLRGIFDLKAAKPSDILKITKQEIPIAKLCDLGTFDLYRFLKKERGIRLPAQYVKKVLDLNAHAIQSLFERAAAPVIRTINYLTKQSAMSKIQDGRYLYDYWNMLRNVYGEVPPALRWPKDLVAAHDQVLLMQREKEEKEISEKIIENSKAYEPLRYENEALHMLIRPCQSQSELIKEGKVLNHCVARYAKDVATGQTMIFFVRKSEDPDTPFYTLEYKNGKVIQNRGKANSARTKEVQLFENLWLEHVEKVRRKENGKNGNSADAAS